MDRVLLIDAEGNLFKLEPPNENLYLINDRMPYTKRLNRISNSEWCFWAIDSDFEVKLYVYQRKHPVQIIEQTNENQRRSIILGRKKFSNNLLKSDPPEFSSINDKKYAPKESFLLPSHNWRWISDWHIQEKTNNNEGWFYAYDFDSTFKPDQFWYANVRQRKWSRKRVFTAYDTLIHIDSPLTCEFVNDIAIGGWSVGNNKLKGVLSVWIACNSGRLYFRKNVSFANPEGTNWIEINLPDYERAISISCTHDGYLWVVTSGGKVLLRNEITTDEPYGNNWIEINSNIPLVQITCTHRLVYALDYNGYVYLRTNTNENREGEDWIRVLKDLSNISVSMTDQLWALSKNKRTLFIGSKIHNVESKSFGWKTVFLPIEIDFVNAKMAYDNLDDLASLKVVNN